MSALLAVVAAALAFALALADSALLRTAFDESGGEVPPPPHEARHRALAFARVLAQLATGAAVAAAFGLDERTGWPMTLAAVGSGLVVVALTETVARELGDALGAGAVRPLALLVRAAELLLTPIVALGARLDAALLRALPVQESTAVSREAAAEQFREIVASEAEVSGAERALLAGVFALGDTQVSDVMVPRVDVLGVEQSTPWSEVIDRVRSAGHSRVPVFDETIDDIVGVLYAKDLLPAVLAGEPPAAGWATLMRPAAFIPPTKRIDDQLRDFRASGVHLAVVVDEYGGTAGILTIEDVLEEIVGEIHDERDEEEAPIEAEEGRRFWVSGRVTLDELSDALAHDFTHDEVATVGGLVYELLGRVPRAGERLTIGPFRVVVERVVRRKIQRVYFERLAVPTPKPEGTRPGPRTAPEGTPPTRVLVGDLGSPEPDGGVRPAAVRLPARVPLGDRGDERRDATERPAGEAR
jgi:CBS domain containing-hemolysin-like protein